MSTSAYVRVVLVGFLLLLPLGAEAQRRGGEGGGKDKGLPLDSVTNTTIEFTTDEATWLSLDVMPDGESIVFELLGDLYTLPMTGGEATRITDGTAGHHRHRAGRHPDSRRTFVGEQ